MKISVNPIERVSEKPLSYIFLAPLAPVGDTKLIISTQIDDTFNLWDAKQDLILACFLLL